MSEYNRGGSVLNPLFGLSNFPFQQYIEFWSEDSTGEGFALHCYRRALP